MEIEKNVTRDKHWMLVEFEGTYTTAHPDGIKGQKVIRPFHVRVKMKKEFLEARGLRGAFSVYYEEKLKRQYPGMISLHQFRMIEATEIDGSKINNPKCMSHADLLVYINEKDYQINTALYDDQELRHEVALYESDKKGQQKLQGQREAARGGKLKISKEINEQEDSLVVLHPSAGVRNEFPQPKHLASKS